MMACSLGDAFPRWSAARLTRNGGKWGGDTFKEDVGVSENSVPLNPMVLPIIISMKNGYFIGNIPNIFRQTHVLDMPILQSACLCPEGLSLRKTAISRETLGWNSCNAACERLAISTNPNMKPQHDWVISQYFREWPVQWDLIPGPCWKTSNLSFHQVH